MSSLIGVQRATASSRSSVAGSRASASLRAAWATLPRSSTTACSVIGRMAFGFCSTMILLDDDGRQPFVAHHARDRPQQLLHDDRRQPFQRLVEQQQPRVQHQRARHGQHLLLAARELGAHVRPALGQAREHRVDPLHVPRARACHGSEVLLHGEGLEDVALLRHPADAGLGALEGGECRDVAARQGDAPRVPARDADERVDQRRLAGAVAPEQGERLARRQRQLDAVEHHGLAVAGLQAVDR
jgi:hypothetical protein